MRKLDVSLLTKDEKSIIKRLIEGMEKINYKPTRMNVCLLLGTTITIHFKNEELEHSTYIRFEVTDDSFKLEEDIYSLKGVEL